MNKQELIKALAAHAEVTKAQAENLVTGLVKLAHQSLQIGEEFAIPDLGKFTVQERAARKGRNPATGEEIEIPAKAVAKFSPAKALKDTLAK